jgi:hypothetical protein
VDDGLGAGSTDEAPEDSAAADEEASSGKDDEEAATIVVELLVESTTEVARAGPEPPEVSPGPTQLEPVKPAGVVGLLSAHPCRLLTSRKRSFHHT